MALKRDVKCELTFATVHAIIPWKGTDFQKQSVQSTKNTSNLTLD